MAKKDSASNKDSESSPWFKNSRNLRKYKDVALKRQAFTKASDNVLRLFSSLDYLHVLHIKPEDHADHLLRLHMFVQAINSQKTFNAGRVISTPAIVIADSKTTDNDGFHQAFWAIEQHIPAKKVLYKEAGYLFDNIALIRGVTDSASSSNARKRAQDAINNQARRLKISGVAWHECTTISLLASMITDVSRWQASFGKAALVAVSMCAGLTMDRGDVRIGAGFPSRTETEKFLAQMRDLKIAMIFVDGHMLGIQTQLESQPPSDNKYHSRATKLPGFPQTLPFLFPPAAYEPIMKKSMDDLGVNIYRLVAAHEGVYGSLLTDRIKKDFEQSKSEWWAKRILEKKEFAADNCKKNVSAHLVNCSLNADAPLDFELNALPGAMLDLCRDTSSIIAMSCEVDFSGPKLRASTANLKKGPRLYILTSTSSDAAISRLHADWNMLLTTVVPRDKTVKIDRKVAGRWLYMAKILRKQMDGIYSAKDFKRLKAEDQRVFKQEVYAPLVNGAMTCLATRSLDTTPLEWWK